ncbi:hypothetical protein [Thiohalophilus sp.]|uniref:hypothetical protein n=1 Tax=Thiohalophilus sp. TaxID=3028392 RepID=UPI002ACE2FCE|nr:hypothetical protein [Thiohalophilus sp.]MDZ7804942.1 hypothetical protein [Thiohalophilus sp.]
MRKFLHYLLLGIVLLSQAYTASASIGGELAALSSAACEHLAAAGSAGDDSHQLCNDHDCHATAHYLGVVVTAYTLPQPVMTHSQIRTGIKQFLSHRDPPPTQPPRSLI